MEIETIKKQIKSVLIGEAVNFTNETDKLEILEFLNSKILKNTEEAEKELFISSNGKYNDLKFFYSNQQEFQPKTGNFTKLILQNKLLNEIIIQLNTL